MTTLREFAAKWMESPVLRPPPDIYASVDGHTGIVLYRDDRFQVQLWACRPDSNITDHEHPSINGLAVRVGGQIKFRRKGKRVTRDDTLPAMLFGKHTMMHTVEPGIYHGAEIGPKGAAFFAITEWNSEPKSVHLDWKGAPLDERHAREIGST